jgi:LuxR family transcriptional regulator, positive regulator of biofilm formation
MNILIDLGSHLMSEAIYQLLVKNGYDHVVVSGKSSRNGFTTHVLLVDSTTLSHDLLARYPDAKVLLIDAGIEPQMLCATLLSYRIHGVLSPNTELQLFKKALTAVSEGQIWIDNGSVKALLHDTGSISQKGKISHISGREQEIIECILQGLSNNEIARRLTLSPHTVKAHLNRIFRKFNITSRSKLMAVAMRSPHPTSA